MKLSNEDYETVILDVKNFVNQIPENLRPECIIKIGQIEHPGISDLDLIFGFRDNYTNSQIFLELFNDYIKNIKYQKIFFHHLPGIYPISQLKLLPTMTYNPSSSLSIISGQISFLTNELDYFQNILNSFEQVHMRIYLLIDMLIRKNTNRLLLVGHSLIHSINCINLLGAKLDTKTFHYFLEIENYRNAIVNGEEYNIENKERLILGLINEFFIILKFLNKKIDDNINAYFSSNTNHFYDDNFLFVNLGEKNDEPKVHKKDDKFLIEGFGWQTKCIYDNFFNIHDSFTIFENLNFLTAIDERRSFYKSIFDFNFNNFANPKGRTMLNPLVHGKNLLIQSRNLIINDIK